jgi:hypothetical protein
MTTSKEPAVEEMMRDAEEAAEPGDIKPGSVINATTDMTMSASELQSAGYVYVYDTRTADRSVVNRNMLQQQLEKRREDGSFVFSTRKPEGIEAARGTFKCLLHVDDPNRERYNQMGLIVCPKDSLRSQYDVSLHMQFRHRREWQTIEGEREEQEKERTRARDDSMAETMRLLAERNRQESVTEKNNGKK